MAFYSGYNTEEATATKVGNWVEEQALRDVTGTSRYDRWVDKGSQLTRHNGLARGKVDTASRVIAHSEQESPKEWNSVLRATYGRPEQHPARNIPRTRGLRQELEEARLMQEAKLEVDEEMDRAQRRRNYAPKVSLTRATYIKHTLPPPEERGRRRMKTADGDAVPAEAMDSNFLTEQGLRAPRPSADDATMEAQLGEKDYLADQPVTFYTQRLTEGAFAHTAAGGGPNVFARNTKFTNDCYEAIKPHVESQDHSDNQISGMDRGAVPTAASTLALDTVCAKIRQSMRQSGRVDGFRTLRDAFRAIDVDGDASLSRPELKRRLRSLGVELTERDFDTVSAHFDADGNGAVSFPEFEAAMRATALPPRRAKLVNLAFDRLDRSGDGMVTVDELIHACNLHDHPAVRDGTTTAEEAARALVRAFDTRQADGRVSREEFADYYRDVSATIGSDADFEATMRKAWGLKKREDVAAIAQREAKRRVRVRYHTDKQEEFEVPAHLGTEISVRKYLHRCGVHSIKAVIFLAPEV